MRRLLLALCATWLGSCAAEPGAFQSGASSTGSRKGPANAALELPPGVGGSARPRPRWWHGPREYPAPGYYSSHPGYR